MADNPNPELEQAKEELLLAIARLEHLLAQATLTQTKSIERMRAQNSAEHGSILTNLRFVSTTVAWLREKWEKFSHGGH